MTKCEFSRGVKAVAITSFFAAVFVQMLPSVAAAYGASLMPSASARPVNTIQSEVGLFGLESVVVQGAKQNVVVGILEAATKDNTKLLWSSYPASVRGRVFNDPSSVSRGGGWM
ncbi:MAG: hypothetical protein K2W95_13535 [Candidatus Obscuribacterales bacterium]|nr:hypothetical protein [Candidatus Obscuribacterales bacterium]